MNEEKEMQKCPFCGHSPVNWIDGKGTKVYKCPTSTCANGQYWCSEKAWNTLVKVEQVRIQLESYTSYKHYKCFDCGLMTVVYDGQSVMECWNPLCKSNHINKSIVTKDLRISALEACMEDLLSIVESLAESQGVDPCTLHAYLDAVDLLEIERMKNVDKDSLYSEMAERCIDKWPEWKKKVIEDNR